MCAQYGKVPQCELWQSKYLKQDKYFIEYHTPTLPSYSVPLDFNKYPSIAPPRLDCPFLLPLS